MNLNKGCIEIVKNPGGDDSTKGWTLIRVVLKLEIRCKDGDYNIEMNLNKGCIEITANGGGLGGPTGDEP